MTNRSKNWEKRLESFVRDEARRRSNQSRIFTDIVTHWAVCLGYQLTTELAAESRGSSADLLEELVQLIQAKTRDYIGPAFMNMDLGNSNRGQFFTPWEVSLLTAKMTLPSPELLEIAQTRPVEISEPTCGAGAMVLAAAVTCREIGLADNQFHITAADIDRTCVLQTLAQSTAAGIAVTAIHADTLRLEMFGGWRTPLAVLLDLDRQKSALNQAMPSNPSATQKYPRITATASR